MHKELPWFAKADIFGNWRGGKIPSQILARGSNKRKRSPKQVCRNFLVFEVMFLVFEVEM